MRSGTQQVSVLLRTGGGVLGAVLVMAACFGEGGEEGVPPDLVVVESVRAVWDDSSRWLLLDEPVTVVGDEHPLLEVVGGFTLADGRVVVGSAGLNEVAVFDIDGSLERILASEGDGPSEVRRLHGVYPCTADTLLVDDRTRFTVQTVDGRVIRTGVVPSNGPNPLLIQGVASDCRTLLVRALEPRGGPALGTSGPRHTTIAWWDSERDEGLDTVARVVEAELFHHRQFGGNVESRIPWGDQARWSARRNVVAVGQWSTPEIEVSTLRAEPARLLRWKQPLERVSLGSRIEFGQRREAALDRFPPLREVLPPLDEFPTIPESVPAFVDLLVDSEGFVWVRDYPAYVLGRPSLFDRGGILWDPNSVLGGLDRWRVFNPTGVLLGEVEVPSAYGLLSVSGELATIVAFSPDGTETVRVLPLARRSR